MKEGSLPNTGTRFVVVSWRRFIGQNKTKGCWLDSERLNDKSLGRPSFCPYPGTPWYVSRFLEPLVNFLVDPLFTVRRYPEERVGYSCIYCSLWTRMSKSPRTVKRDNRVTECTIKRSGSLIQLSKQTGLSRGPSGKIPFVWLSPTNRSTKKNDRKSDSFVLVISPVLKPLNFRRS